MTKSGFTFRTGNQSESVCMIELHGRAERELEIAMIQSELTQAI